MPAAPVHPALYALRVAASWLLGPLLFTFVVRLALADRQLDGLLPFQALLAVYSGCWLLGTTWAARRRLTRGPLRTKVAPGTALDRALAAATAVATLGAVVAFVGYVVHLGFAPADVAALGLCALVAFPLSVLVPLAFSLA